ncbi:MAG: type VI secretion protein [marine bacterium B5-7]|nr:MAG: type VI secretion protein [marine bacterium B5-7]
MTSRPTFHLADEQAGLKAAFQGAKHFLAKTLKQDKLPVNLKQLPRFVVLGPHDAGKTTLIANSGLKFILEKKFDKEDLDTIRPTRHTQWWVTDKSIFLDVNGHYGYWERHHHAFPDLWKTWLRLLKKFENPAAIKGVLVVCDIERLCRSSANQVEDMVRALAQQVIELQKTVKHPLSVQLVISKMDRLKGFQTFFSDLFEDEREQLWGIDLHQHDHLSEADFDEHYKHLTAIITKKQFKRLQQETLPDAKIDIKDFPLQLAAIQSRLRLFCVEFANAIQHYSSLHLQGIHLTSGRQDQGAKDYLLQPVSQHVITDQLPSPTMHQKNTGYFIQQLLDSWLLQPLITTTQQQHVVRNWRWFCGIGLAGLLGLSTWVYAMDFQQAIRGMHTAEHALTQYQVLSKQIGDDAQLSAILPSLNALYEGVTALEDVQHFLLHQLMPKQVREVYTSVSQVYALALQKRFAAQLDSALIAQLDNNPENPAYLYGSLSSLLMLQGKQTLDKDFVSLWMQNDWQQTQKQPATRIALNAHLQRLLALKISHHPKANKKLNDAVKQTRLLLNALPAEQLGLLMMQVNADNPLVNPFGALKFLPLFSLPKQFIGLPKLYTVAGYQTLFEPKLSATIHAVQHGNAVLGVRTSTQDDAAIKAKLLQSYTQAYAALWQALIQHIKVHAPKTLKARYDALMQLLESDNGLQQFLQILNEETQLNPASPGVGIISPAFLGLHQLATEPGALERWVRQLQPLKNYMAQVVASDQPGASSWEIVKARVLHNIQGEQDAAFIAKASLLPSPLSTGLTKLVKSSWTQLLHQAKKHLTHAWNLDVVTPYKEQIAHRYPFSKQATHDVSLENFQAFFGPDGRLQRFYQEYLTVFLDNQHANWHWKQFSSLPWHFSDALLSQLHRGQIIQSMFYPEGQQNFRWQFAFVPENLDPAIKQFSLSLNKQELLFEQQARQPQFMIWPQEEKQTLTLAFEDVSGQLYRAELHGPWALFRMLDQEQFFTTRDPEKFQLALSLNGHPANFQIIASKNVNPLIPGVLEGFSCPEKLFS